MAAADEENPVMRWIGREVKRFLKEADIHLPLLLRIAAAPADMDADMASMVNDAGELELEEDEELNLGDHEGVTEEDLQQEEQEEPAMMEAARKWDHFFELVAESNAEWAAPDLDTDEYREQRAVTLFNKATVVARDIKSLNPELAGWVLHVLVFIVPRQYVSMGDPTRRSCDACESLGSSMKKFIRHLTCRRRHSLTQEYCHSKPEGGKLWRQTFKRGYIEQTFRRICVRSELIHGEANSRYLQRADHRLLNKGRVSKANIKPSAEQRSSSVEEALSVPFVWTREAALALWS